MAKTSCHLVDTLNILIIIKLFKDAACFVEYMHILFLL